MAVGREIIFVCLFWVSINTLSAQTLMLADRMTTDYVIVLPGSASPAEKTAAAELKKYLKLITNADFPIVAEKSVPPTVKKIWVGETQFTLSFLKTQNYSDFKPDEIRILTKECDLILCGAKPRGSLYAVYTFIENLGVRFWAPGEEFVPALETLRIPTQEFIYTPQFIYREAHYFLTNTHPDFAVKMKNNGALQEIPIEWGGRVELLGWCHTFGRFLIPPEKYFEKHPEWFSEINGKRVKDKQLCLTNPKVREELTKNALEWLRKNPEAGIISISQNDSYPDESFCECLQCKALDDREGSHSGSILNFVNQVAADIEKEFPGVLIETLAYHYSLNPPATLKPRHNVIIRFAYADLNAPKPLPERFVNALSGWGKISEKMMAWHYGANFYNYLVPHPNLLVLGEDIKTFAKFPICGLFYQGDGYTTIGDFIRLRQYLVSKMLWNPELDPETVMSEFMTGYYGAAAPELRKYLETVNDSAMRSKAKIEIFNSNTDWLDDAAVLEGYRYFQNAFAAVLDNTELTERVARERIPLLMVILSRPNVLAQIEKDETAKHMVEEIIRIAEQNNNKSYGENKDFSVLAGKLKRQFKLISSTDIPLLCKDIAESDWIDFPADTFDVAAPWGTREADPQNPKSEVAVLKGDNGAWSLQVRGAGGYGDEPYRFFAEIRAEGSAERGTGVNVGFHDSKGKVPLAAKEIPLRKIKGSTYVTIPIGSRVINDDMILFIAGPDRSGEVERVFVKRIFAIKESVAQRILPDKRLTLPQWVRERQDGKLWKDIQAGEMGLSGPWAETEIDPLVSTSCEIVSLTGDPNAWAIQLKGTDELSQLGECRIFGNIRFDGQSAKGSAISIGIYDSATKKIEYTRDIPFSAINSQEYTLVELAKGILDKDRVLFISGLGRNGATHKILLERIFVAPFNTTQGIVPDRRLALPEWLQKRKDKKSWRDVQAVDLILIGPDAVVDVDIDPKSRQKQEVVAFSNDINTWAVQLKGNSDFKKLGPCRIFASMRYDGTPLEGTALSIGIYNAATQKVEFTRDIPFASIKKDEYMTIELANTLFDDNKTLYIAGLGRSGTAHKIWIERLLIAPQQTTNDVLPIFKSVR